MASHRRLIAGIAGGILVLAIIIGAVVIWKGGSGDEETMEPEDARPAVTAEEPAVTAERTGDTRPVVPEKEPIIQDETDEVTNSWTDDIVLETQEWYQTIESNAAYLTYIPFITDVSVYVDGSGDVAKLIVQPSYDNSGYTKEYFCRNGQLSYAVLSGGNGRSQLYYYNGELIRYVDENGVTSDYGDLDGVQLTGQLVMEQADKLLTMTDKDGYILRDSSSRYLTREDLQNLSAEELRLARNEIYARHCRIFKDEALAAYFGQKSWYMPLYDEILDTDLNEYEIANRDLIVQMEGELN